MAQPDPPRYVTLEEKRYDVDPTCYLGGGMVGHVWRATHGGEAFALKLSRVRVSLDVRPPVQRRRLAREGELMVEARAKGLRCVARIHAQGWADNDPDLYILAMELGQTLAEVLPSRRRLSDEGVAAVAVQVAATFARLHDPDGPFKVVFRDFKPQNLLVEREGADLRVKLIDFGSVLELDDTSVPEVAKTTVGSSGPITPSHLAPEVFRTQICTPASDLFALGMTLAQSLLGGECPEHMEDIEDAYARLNPDQGPLDDRIQGLLDGLLDPDPAARCDAPRTLALAKEILGPDAYEAVIAAVEGPVAVDDPGTAIASQPAKSALDWGLGAGAAAVSFTLAWWYLSFP